MSNAKQTIEAGKAVLGIEFGSTRIKAVLVNEAGEPVASGAHDWENRLEEGIWTYSLDDIWTGLTDCYGKLTEDVKEKYDTVIKSLAAIGFSGMMHGYMAFDKDGELLVPFRTWRNTITGEAAAALTKEFSFNIPQRWSIAHLYQAILNGEEHVGNISYFTTLAGYIHWKLTGEKVLGVGEASGMFPIDAKTRDYNQTMIDKFDALVAPKGYPWKLREILPKVLVAGEAAGTLSAEGAKLLDKSGNLSAGIPLCPPEGDAGTGMAATNSVAPRTGNVSAGTSIFAMVVLEKALSKVYPEIDMVTTPAGDPVAMVHCNNCTSDLNAWVELLAQNAELCGAKVNKGELFTKLFNLSLQGASDCGGVIPVNYYSGEGVTHFDAGRPMLLRGPESDFSLANLMRANIYSAFATLAIGLDILNEEHVALDTLLGHGGLFKTPGVAQRYLAAAAHTAVTCTETAGEGGPYGMALLAAYRVEHADGETLANYLQNRVFAGAASTTLNPDAADEAGFAAFLKEYKKALCAERTVVETM